MRTTVDLPDQLLREAKAAAALEGRTLREFLVEAVQQRLHGGDSRRTARVSLPLVRSSAPGSLALTNEDIGRLLDETDAPLSS